MAYLVRDISFLNDTQKARLYHMYGLTISKYTLMELQYFLVGERVKPINPITFKYILGILELSYNEDKFGIQSKTIIN
jgi:hypothetical protein